MNDDDSTAKTHILLDTHPGHMLTVMDGWGCKKLGTKNSAFDVLVENDITGADVKDRKHITDEFKF